MSDEIERRYFQDFGKADYETALQVLWEEHCRGPRGGCPNWPPTLNQVKKEIENIQTGRFYENERR